ncbi:hypothetical protein FXO38_24614 [Capsicum annuum]|nr:hypothetical protein FXO38_24614 [Capsicum annuum]
MDQKEKGATDDKGKTKEIKENSECSTWKSFDGTDSETLEKQLTQEIESFESKKDKPYSPEHEKPNLGPGHAIGLSSKECTPNVISRLQCPDNPSLSQPFILRHSTLHTPPGEPIIHTMGNTRSPFLSNEHNFCRKPRMGRKHSIGLTNLMQQRTGENVRKLCGTKEPEEMLTITEEQEGKNSLISETGSPVTHEIPNQLKEKKQNRTTLIQSILHDELHNLEC